MTRPRVLLADDYPRFAAAMSRLLAQHNYEIVGHVQDGERLLAEAARLQPDVVLLDLFMPRMNGLDACRKLTSIVPRTKVIVLTGESGEDLRQAALAAGAFAFIEKQEIGTELLPALQVVCGA